MSRLLAVAAVFLVVGARPAPAQRPDRAAFAARVDTIVTAAMTAEQIPGVSLAVVRGTDTIIKAYGYADLENRVPATPVTVFRIGSDVRVVFEVTNGRAVALTLFQGGPRRAPRVE